ncbi:MAG: FAD-linked oxidase C-terminal domain-containing protein [Phycisphaerae bacterium]|nr:FAD-linked oxidase C-terminal domain-containing protein [Phycisphaerae bacterium]
MSQRPTSTSLPILTGQTGARAAAGRDVARWERALRASLRGEVRFDRLTRTIYATDASLYEIAPVGVAMPRDASDVVRLVRECREFGVPIVARGAGTGIAGGAIGAGLCVDFSRYMTGISELDPAARTVRVEPGVVLDDLNAFLRPHGLHFAADVATSSRATIGGMIANNSCGAHSVFYGRTVDYVDELTVVLSDGSTHVWPHLPYAELPEKGGRIAQRPFAFDEPQASACAVARYSAGATKSADDPAFATLSPLIREALERVREEFRDEVLERYPRVLRRNGGYALDRFCQSDDFNPATLICGSEGTLGLVTSARLRLMPLPRCAALLVIQFESVLEAVGATPAILPHRPAAVELIDDLILSAGAPQIPPGLREQFLSGMPKAILAVELYDDDAARLRERIDALDRALASSGVGTLRRRVFDSAAQAAVWDMRKRGFGLLMSRPGDEQPHEFIEDAAVDPRDLRAYMTELGAMLASEEVRRVGYYAHASVGVIHVRPTLNLKQPADVARLQRIAEGTARLVAKFGGAFTGEHGDGLVRSWSLAAMYGERITRAFAEVKRAFDPVGLFNPGKIVNPRPISENLRYRGIANRELPIANDGGAQGPRGEGVRDGAADAQPPVATFLDFSAHGGMAGLAGMCSGVGQCRQKLVGVMCPSYVATLDEQHTTRARANALRAALQGDRLMRGLDDPALHEAMDLCLSCKACKSECPTGVDMARLKAEWQAQLHERRGVDAASRFFADAPRAIRSASRWPRLANFVQRLPLTRWMLEKLYGLDSRIELPELASRTFRAWWRDREAQGGAPRGGRSSTRGPVAYFVDTWTNHLWPEVGIAAVRLLEAAGHEVIVPELGCCGRPMISKGLLREARELAEFNAKLMQPLVDRGVPLLGSEPSCVLTFVDEFPQFVRSDGAKRIAGMTRTVEQHLAALIEGGLSLAELARRRGEAATLARRDAEMGQKSAARVLYHGHCHQKALIGTSATMRLLGAIPGIAASEINSGCCGMAGSFGHEREHYEVSRAIGEQRLFPAVRERGAAEVVVSGFSCREQLSHHAGVRPRHVLELVAELALGRE